MWRRYWQQYIPFERDQIFICIHRDRPVTVDEYQRQKYRGDHSILYHLFLSLTLQRRREKDIYIYIYERLCEKT